MKVHQNGRRNRRDREQGMTMAELIVAMFVLGVLSTAVVGVFVSSTQAFQVATAINTNTKQAANGMNEMARVIRAGTEKPVRNLANSPAFVEATSNSLTVYAFINFTEITERPKMIRFSVDAKSRLIEQSWSGTTTAGYWSFPAPCTSMSCPVAPESTRVLANSVAPAGAKVAPLFAYLNSDGGVVSPLNTTTMGSIASVRVSLTIQGSADDQRSRVVVENTVGIPNLSMNRSVE